MARSRRSDEAIAAWNNALTLNPRDVEALANLGNLCRALGRISEAIDYCRRPLGNASARPQVISNLGLTYEQQGRLDEAIACYRRALELKRMPGTHSNLLLDLAYHGNISPAKVF